MALDAPANILILEDDANLLDLLSETFEDVGYSVYPASGPELAIEIFKKHKIDLVLSDIRMAGCTDGLGVLMALKSARPGLKCVVMTGYASDESPVRAMQIEVDDYVYKPFRLPAMLAVVKRVLESDRRNNTLIGQLSQLLSSVPSKIKQLVDDSKSSSLRDSLVRERSRLLQTYYVGIRSKQIARSTALEIWDLLVPLEAATQVGYESLKLNELQALGRGYRLAYEKTIEGAKLGAASTPKERPSGALNRNIFFRFYDEIQKGGFNADHLMVAFQLAEHPKVAGLTGELGRLHQILHTAI